MIPKRIFVIGGIVIAAIFLLFVSPFETNNSGYRTYVQRMDGYEFVRFEPGMFYAGFFARTTEYPDVVTVQFEDKPDDDIEASFVDSLITAQFSDGTYAQMGFTVKWKLPTNEAAMIMIHKDYRSSKRLAQSLAQYSKECMNYSTPMMESERHYSGGKSELSELFKYQLRNGQFVLDAKESTEKDSSGAIVRRMYDNYPRRDAQGAYILSKSDVQTYNIEPSFVAITHCDYESVVDEMLKAKVKQSTQEAVSKQELVTAQQSALTSRARGEAAVAEARALALAEKEKAVIDKQKEVEVSRLEVEKAKYEAAKVKWEGDAKAAANRALVQAGLTPLERATIQKETAIGVATELAKIQFPSMMIFGGDGKNGATDPFAALGLQSFMNIQSQLSGGN